MYHSKNKQTTKIFLLGLKKKRHLFTSFGVWVADLNTMRHTASRKPEADTHFCQQIMLKTYMVTYPLIRQAEYS